MQPITGNAKQILSLDGIEIGELCPLCVDLATVFAAAKDEIRVGRN